MKFFFGLFLAAVAVFFSIQAYQLYAQSSRYQTEFIDGSKDMAELLAEHDTLTKDLEYYQRDENLSKELRSRFNYREAGEELLILVPDTE